MSKNKSLFMETTQIEESKTVAEIQRILSTKGASSILVEYELGKVSSVCFRLKVREDEIPFRLPCRWKTVEALLRRTNRNPRRGDTYEQWARRVAWRQVLRWVEAQLALIETGMVQPEEVFLPYALVGSNGKQMTMFELVKENKMLALPNKKDTQ